MLTDEIMRRFAASMPPSTEVDLPPKCFVDMEGEFVLFDEESKRLTARFPVLERYQNPLLTMQGGLIVAAIDNTVGPLSWLIAPPSVTTQMNTSYIRPVARDDAYIHIEATVDEVTRRQVFLSARVTNPIGKLVAVCYVTCAIIQAGK